jgi:hypothetical protein
VLGGDGVGLAQRQLVEELQRLQGARPAVAVKSPEAALQAVGYNSPAIRNTATGTPCLHLLVRTPQQLDAAISIRPSSITLDYLDLYGLKPSLQRVRSAGLAVRVAAPRVCKYTQPYQVVLAVVEKKGSINQTFEYLENKIKDFSGDHKLDGPLIVPNIFWKIKTNFRELENKPLANADFEEYFISKTFQETEFRLDRTGTVLKSEAYAVAALCMPSEKREFLFNKPFLLYIKKRGCDQPFFMMWVDNAELLAKKN